MTRNQKRVIVTALSIVITTSLLLNLAFIFKINSLQEEIKRNYYTEVIEPMLAMAERIEKCEKRGHND